MSDLYRNPKVLVGKTITSVTGLVKGSEEVHIYTEDNKHYKFYHEQDCCECVDLEDFELDFETGLVVSVDVVSNSEDVDSDYGDCDSKTWTFYKIETNKGELFMRWIGVSNGYYSESVDFEEVDDV